MKAMTISNQEESEMNQDDYPVWESMKEITKEEIVLMVVYLVVAIPFAYGLCKGVFALGQLMGGW